MAENETALASQVFDQLQQAMTADPAGLTELYRDYLADAWQALRTLCDAVQRRQEANVRTEAHRLKGSSLVLGARAVAQCASALEQIGLNADIQSTEALLDQTRHELRRVQAELSERLGAGVVPAGETAA
jgi:HPt (histidine-containing phosphotransfer) domain-containing protein